MRQRFPVMARVPSDSSPMKTSRSSSSGFSAGGSLVVVEGSVSGGLRVHDEVERWGEAVVGLI